MTKRKGSKRKAIDEGNTSTSKEPRTSTAEPGQEKLEEQPTEEAQQPQQEQIEEEQPAQAEECQAVKEIGLGSLLDLQITNFRRQMGLWLVENFDPRSCTLKLQNGQTIHIIADDVAAVLGLPKGNIEITKRTVKAIPRNIERMEVVL
nr:uncharacterized protein LOC109191529 [Ipomoea batatas]